MKTILLFIALTMFGASGIAQDVKRCEAITTKGVQCKKAAINGQKFCTVHDESAPRCGVITSKGKPCRNLVKKKGDKCKWHNDNQIISSVTDYRGLTSVRYLQQGEVWALDFLNECELDSLRRELDSM